MSASGAVMVVMVVMVVVMVVVVVVDSVEEIAMAELERAAVLEHQNWQRWTRLVDVHFEQRKVGADAVPCGK